MCIDGILDVGPGESIHRRDVVSRLDPNHAR